MVGWKFQRWKCHVFDVIIFPGVVFPGFDHLEVALGENNEILWVDISLFAFFGALAGLVQLRLEERPGIVGSVVRRIRDITPARRQAVRDNVLGKIEDVLLLSGLGIFVRVRIHAKDEAMVF